MDDTGRFFQRKATGPEEIISSDPFVVYIEKDGEHPKVCVNLQTDVR